MTGASLLKWSSTCKKFDAVSKKICQGVIDLLISICLDHLTFMVASAGEASSLSIFYKRKLTQLLRTVFMIPTDGVTKTDQTHLNAFLRQFQRWS